jgi:hypothetical protein
VTRAVIDLPTGRSRPRRATTRTKPPSSASTLASDASSYSVGAGLVVDGDITAGKAFRP